MVSSNRVSDLFVDVTHRLVTDFDVVDFLHQLTTIAVEVGGGDAAGLMIADPQGRLRVMAASNEDARLLELFQIQNAEGPCLEAHRSGEEVSDVALESATPRWPAFAPVAAELGFRAAHCFPLRLHDHVIGAMNLFRREPIALTDEERRIVRALVDLATIGLMQKRAAEQADQLQFALHSRSVIEQAKGAVARALDVGVNEAFEVIRRYARAHRRPLTEVAAGVVEDRVVLEAVSAAWLGRPE